jgi:putative cell wall-binding protein
MNKNSLLISLIALMICSLVLLTTPQSSNAQSGTQVGGILWDNTTWTKKGSPYLLTSTIQIPENSTLTIEPGVAVSFKDTDNYAENMFVIQGELIAHGTANDKITFKGNRSPLGESTTFFSRSTTKVFNISYCTFDTGRYLLFQNSNYPSQYFISNCKVVNVRNPSTLETQGTESYIENNTFINSAGFGLHDSGKFIFTNNLVVGSNDFIYHYLDVSEIILNKNSFIDNTLVIRITDGNDINAQNNYWGTTNTSKIDNVISDKNDDINAVGFVNYLPILTEPDINTPTCVTATAASGGAITPNGIIELAYGSNQAFTITANNGYHVTDVLVNGSSVGAVTTYTVQNIQEATNISAIFAADPTPTPTITPSPTSIVPEFPALIAVTMLIVITMLALVTKRSQGRL